MIARLVSVNVGKPDIPSISSCLISVVVLPPRKYGERKGWFCLSVSEDFNHLGGEGVTGLGWKERVAMALLSFADQGQK